METSLFILALSKTLPESCLQGVIVYLVLQLLLAVFKKSTPSFRFNLFYAASVLLFATFVFNLFQHYNQVRASIVADTFISNPSPNFGIASTVKISWWQQLTFYTNHYAYTITGLYLIGLIFCVLRLALGLININWFRRDRHLRQQDIWTEKIKLLSTQFNLLKTVSIFLSDKIQVPLTIGFFKPIIVFPIALINHLSIQQTEAILLHELAHIKRSDYLLNIVLSIIQSFLFFNPIIWLLSREINKYREQCCDDLVLEKTNDSIAYAKALLQIEQFRSSQLTLALAANGKKYTLLNRIKRITQMKTNNPSPQNKLIVLLLAITTIGISFAWNMPVKKALKRLQAKQVTSFKLTVTKPNKPTYSWSADKITVSHSKPDTSNIKFVSDSIVYQPNSKTDKKYTISGKRLVLDFKADTVIKSKNKFKIVLEDSVGNKKEYNSIEELPANEQKEFLKENRKLSVLPKLMVVPGMNFKLQPFPGFNDSNRFAYVEKFKDNPQWKKQAELMRKQGELMRKQGEDMRKQFNSPEWKATMKKLQEESAAIGEQARKQFDTPEFKLKMEKLKEESRAIGEQARKQFDTPEFKKQMEKLRVEPFQNKTTNNEMLKYYQSPEWKKQQKKIQKEIEKSQKEWRKSYDEQPKPVMPEKSIVPEKL